MPELPEVEHAARLMGAALRGTRITRVQAPASRIFRGSSAAAFRRALTGRRLRRLDRRGKNLLLTLDDGTGLWSHLGMSGRWVRVPPEEAPRGSRARLVLERGDALFYRDPRMFGRLLVGPVEALWARPELARLGPDPLADGIDLDALAEALAATRRPIKVALMDQTLLAGLGNIQVTEALFAARVHPARPAHTLGRAELGAVREAVLASLHATLEKLENQESRYLSEGGDVANPFVVYGREGEACPRCATRLRKMSLGGRGTVYCPACQKPGEVSR